MKIYFTYPSDKEILKIQQKEGAYYWTKCFENFLRKHGLVYIPSRMKKSFQFVGRHTVFDASSLSFAVIECPSKDHGFDFPYNYHKDESIQLYDHNKNYIGTFGYPKIRLRKIPPRGEKYSEPYLYTDDTTFHSHRPLQWQSLDENLCDKVYAYCKKEGDFTFYPCIFEKDNKLLLGIPLFDLVGIAASFPPLEEGYYDTLIPAIDYGSEKFFFNAILLYLRKHDIQHIISKIWPEKFQACFTVRHDYDRPISLLKHMIIMIFYRIMNIKTSFSLLHYNIQHLHCWVLKKFKHEINLHCTTSTQKDFQGEFHDVQKQSGASFSGITCHGGQGARGWLGDVHYDLLEKNHLFYGEILGRQTGLPQKVNRVKNDLPEITNLYIPASHISIDAGMKKHEHYLEDLLKSVPCSLSRSEHVVLMSHPDIHMKEVFKLIFKTQRKEYWKATFQDVLLWTQNTRYNSCFDEHDNRIHITLPQQQKWLPVYYYFKKGKYNNIALKFSLGLFKGSYDL